MKFLMLTLCLILFGSCGDSLPMVTPPITINSDTVFTRDYLESGGMYSMHYKLKVLGSGEVLFKGNCQHEVPEREERWKVAQDALEQLAAAYKKADFSSLQDSYGQLNVDGATFTISLQIDGQEKTVERLSDPKTADELRIRELEKTFNRIVEAEPRIRQCFAVLGRYPYSEVQ